MSSYSTHEAENLNLDNNVRRTGIHYVGIGEHSDLWMGEMSVPDGGIHVVAVKVLRGASSTNENHLSALRRKLGREGTIWKRLDHPNVAGFYGLSFNCGYMPALVLPYYKNGNIIDYLKHNPNTTSEEKMQFVKGVASGLRYLHGFEQPIVHGDIRGANIFIDDAGQVRLADYGLALIIDSSQFTSTKTAGTCRWTAPEVMNPSEELEDTIPPFTLKSDIYAFAMTAIEIFTGQAPFNNNKNDSAVIFWVLDGNRPDMPEYLERVAGPLIRRCWDQDAAKRPDATEVCESLEQTVKQEPRPESTGVMAWFGSLILAPFRFFS